MTSPTAQAQDHVYTHAELRNPTRRPRFRRLGDHATVRLEAGTMRGEPAWRLPSPCCGVVTVIPQQVLAQVAAGQHHGVFECGKPWHLPRGNPTAGCRAHYRYTCDPAQLAGGGVVTVRATWSGY